MKQSNLVQHLIGLGIILAVILVFCLPALQGKILNSGDYVSWKYMSHESKSYTDEHGGPAYWTNSMFGGMPSFTSYGHETGNLIGDLQNAIMQNTPRPISLLFVCAIACYVLGYALGFSLWLRVLLALAFVFSSYNPILASAGHDGKLIDIGFSCGVLAGMFLILDKKYWLGAAVYTFFFALLFTAGHYQIIYYLFLLLVLAAIAVAIEEFKQKDFKSTFIKIGIIIAGTLIGILPNMQGVLLTKDYTKSTMRGGQSELTIDKKAKKTNGGLDIDYAFTWSQGRGETFSLLVPNVMGPMGREKFAEGATAEKLSELGVSGDQANGFLNSLPDYWGPQPFIAGPVYFGVIIVLLFIFGLITVKSHHKWWIVGGSILFILMSWGKNFGTFNNFLFDYLPAYNKFRTPSMALAIPSILFPLLGVWGLHQLITGITSKEEAWKALKISAGITLALVLIGGVFSGIWQNFEGLRYQDLLGQLTQAFGSAEKANVIASAMKSDMSSAVRADGIRSLVFLLLSLGLMWAYIKDKINANMVMIALALLVVVDLFAVDKRYLSDEHYVDADVYESEMFGPRPVDQQILQDKDPYYRVQDLSVDPYNDARGAYFHKLVGGYNPAKMEVYQDLIDVQLRKNNTAVYNMLNTKYFIVPGQNNSGPQVMPNPDACGNAWFVDEIKMVKTADEEMLALNAPSLSGDTTMKGDFNPKKTAIVRETFKDKLSKTAFIKDSTASIKLTKYGINDLAFESNNSQDGFAVFSDIYYDGGWHCTIDGKETPIIKANYLLRAIQVPGGKHSIAFNFDPPKAKLGKTINTIGSLLSIGILLLGIGMSFRRKKNDA